MTYVSVFETINVTNPFGLQANTDQETGICELNWNYNEGSGFQNFNIYRNDVLIAQTQDMNYADQFSVYGYYTYKVTAFYGGDIGSPETIADTQCESATSEVSRGNQVAN